MEEHFTYRYLVLFEQWHDNKRQWSKYTEKNTMPILASIKELSLLALQIRLLHRDSLSKYHKNGTPNKLAIKLMTGYSEYLLYFWFRTQSIYKIFRKFYGAHPDTKTDFIIRIDAEKRKYELALYRYGLKEPQIIPEDVYQLLVFKNKFEDYRSENYNQKRGAWIW